MRKLFLALAALGWSVASIAQQDVCAGWLTEEFWESAPLVDVAGCLETGADVNARSSRGFTPLHYAAFYGSPEVVDLLLEAGAYVNAHAGGNSTPLNAAIFGGSGRADPEVVTLLLGAGAHVNGRSPYSSSPLFQAVSNDLPEIAALLIEAGADANATGEYARFFADAYDSALERGDTEWVELLRAAGVVDGETRQEQFQLYNACKPMDIDVALQADSAVEGLSEKNIQAAIESRLRTARLYDSWPSTSLSAYVHIMSAGVGSIQTGWVYTIDLRFNKRVRDEASVVSRLAPTWERGSLGTASMDSVADAIVNSIRDRMDEFLAEYLRVNEDACE